jgi:hypothetical protein
VLDVDPAVEVPWARRQLTVLAEDLGAGLSADQTAGLLRLAREMCGKEHVRLLAAVQDAAVARPVAGVELVECRRDPRSGHSVLRPENACVPPQPTRGTSDAVDLER